MPNGQWQGSNRKATLPSNWQTLRKRVLDRDGHSCHMCDGPATHVDHVHNSASGGSDSLSNLAAICEPCHRTKSSSEGGRAAQARIPKRMRPRETHPGLKG